jgi:hypothetical protein
MHHRRAAPALTRACAAIAAAAAAAAAALAAAPSAARADEAKRVVIFPFEGFDLPAAMEKAPNQLGAVVELRFRSEGYDIAASTLVLRDMTIAVGCTAMDGACARALAEHFKVDAMVIGKLVAKDGAVEALVRRYAHDGALLTDLHETLPAAAGELPGAFTRIADAIVTGTGTAPGTDAVPPGRTGPGSGTAAPPPSRGFSPLAMSFGVAGIVLAGAAVPFALLTARANRDFEELGPLETTADFDAAEPIVRRGQIFETMTEGFLIAGGVALGAAVIIGLLGRSGPAGATPAATISATPLPGGALVTLEAPWN